MIGPNIKLYRDLGLDGALIEGYGVNGDGDFVQLRSWLTSGMLWNPDQDPERLLTEFMRGYYGAAAEPLMAYQRLMETYWLRHVPILSRGHFTFDHVKITLMNEAEELFDRAEAAVADAPELLARVRRERMPLRALWIQRYHDLRRQAAESGAPFRGPADPLAALADYKADLAQLDFRLISFHQTFDELFARWEDFIKIPPQPVKDLDPAKPGVRVMQEDDLIPLYYGKHLRLVADSLASDGRALYSEGGDYSWALRYQGALAPGRYRVRIRIRVDRAKDTGSAFVIGLYDGAAPADLPVVVSVQALYRRFLSVLFSCFTESWPVACGHVGGFVR